MANAMSDKVNPQFVKALEAFRNEEPEDYFKSGGKVVVKPEKVPAKVLNVVYKNLVAEKEAKRQKRLAFMRRYMRIQYQTNKANAAKSEAERQLALATIEKIKAEDDAV